MRRIVHTLALLASLIAGFSPAIAQAPAAVPALPDSERRTQYAITNSTCACAVNFALFGDSTDYAQWLEVWLNGRKLTAVTDWTLTSPSGSIGNLARPITNAIVTFTAAQTGTVQIVGARRSRRTSQFSTQPSARDLNQVVTDLVAVAREAWDKINDTSGRIVQAPPGETMAVLPTSAVRSGTYALFNTSGNLIQGASQGAVEGATVASLTGTSATPALITTGPVTLQTQTSRQWLVGTYLTVANSSDGSNYMHGPITAYTSGTGSVTVNVQDTSGSGSFNGWNLTIAGTRGTTGPTGPAGAGVTSLTAGTGLTGGVITTSGTVAADIATYSQVVSTSSNKLIDAAGAAGALGLFPLADAATIAVDFNNVVNAIVTLSGNRTLGNPTNATNAIGRCGTIYVVQDATGSRTLVYGSNWKFSGGTYPVATTTGGSLDALSYCVRSSTSIPAAMNKDFR